MIQLFFVLFFFFLVSPALLVIVIWNIFSATGTFSRALIKEYGPGVMLFFYQSVIVRNIGNWLVKHEKHRNKQHESISAIIKFLLVMEFYVVLVPLLGYGSIDIISKLSEGDFSGWNESFTEGVSDASRIFALYTLTVALLKNGADLV